jgi:hypothetical protein
MEQVNALSLQGFLSPPRLGMARVEIAWVGVGGVPGGSAGGSLGKDSPMTSWLGVTTEVLNHLSRVG